jgi:hypothetical protein
MAASSRPPSTDTFSDEETVRRREAALKRMLSTPPKQHAEMKIGKKASPSGGQNWTPIGGQNSMPIDNQGPQTPAPGCADRGTAR